MITLKSTDFHDVCLPLNGQVDVLLASTNSARIPSFAMKILAVILLGCTATVVSAQKSQPAKAAAASVQMDAARLTRIPARMKQFVDAGTAAGFVTLVARHGRIASLEAVGYLDRETKTPMRTDSIFRIKSMTKPMTAAGIMLLIDEGKISLLDPVEQYLPEFKGLKLNPCGLSNREQPCDQPLTNPARLITVRDLLTHTSGLHDTTGTTTTPINTLAERVSAGAQGPLISQPGTEWRYCNFCYATLGRLIEVVSGQHYDVFMAQHLFEPLSMKDTYYFLPKEKEKRLAALYAFDTTGKLNPVAPAYGDDRAAQIPGPEGGPLQHRHRSTPLLSNAHEQGDVQWPSHPLHPCGRGHDY